jgi:hypothetical protein
MFVVGTGEQEVKGKGGRGRWTILSIIHFYDYFVTVLHSAGKGQS